MQESWAQSPGVSPPRSSSLAVILPAILTDWHPRPAIGGPPPASVFGWVVPPACGFASMARGGPVHAGRAPALPARLPPGPKASVARPRRPVCPSGPPTEPAAGSGVPRLTPGAPPRSRGGSSGKHDVSRTLPKRKKTPEGLHLSLQLRPPVGACRRGPSQNDPLSLGRVVGGWVRPLRRACPFPFPPRPCTSRGYLVDPASSICLSQRLSHASLSTHGRYSETANGSLNQLWFL